MLHLIGQSLFMGRYFLPEEGTAGRGRIPRELQRVTTPKTHGMFSVIKVHGTAETVEIR
jgi:hypothetical protein